MDFSCKWSPAAETIGRGSSSPMSSEKALSRCSHSATGADVKFREETAGVYSVDVYKCKLPFRVVSTKLDALIQFKTALYGPPPPKKKPSKKATLSPSVLPCPFKREEHRILQSLDSPVIKQGEFVP